VRFRFPLVYRASGHLLSLLGHVGDLLAMKNYARLEAHKDVEHPFCATGNRRIAKYYRLASDLGERSMAFDQRCRT
jgi:hypothetical protein